MTANNLMEAADRQASPTTPVRTWTITTTTGFTVAGYLPGWAEEDPSASDVPLDKLPAVLDDVVHREPFDGQAVRLASGGYGPGEEREVFGGAIECRPDPDEGRPAVPVAQVHVIEDFWINDLDPDALTKLAAALRAQADRLDHEVRPRLIAYRQDWAEHRRAA